MSKLERSPKGYLRLLCPYPAAFGCLQYTFRSSWRV